MNHAYTGEQVGALHFALREIAIVGEATPEIVFNSSIQTLVPVEPERNSLNLPDSVFLYYGIQHW
ncbi:MAG: hypothetical protein IT223_11750 [Crocinitomicaceae bacterium]|nr:hypothetical protein [Crocinitomicaceae bacterium]